MSTAKNNSKTTRHTTVRLSSEARMKLRDVAKALGITNINAPIEEQEVGSLNGLITMISMIDKDEIVEALKPYAELYLADRERSELEAERKSVVLALAKAGVSAKDVNVDYDDGKDAENGAKKSKTVLSVKKLARAMSK